MIKRSIDLLMSGIGLALCSPLMLFAAILVKLSSPGPVLFLQKRVGKNFQAFSIYKFRTMVENAPLKGGSITCGEDPRITRLGRLLRKTKMDELPQLLNVLKGEMSFVGPRPEVPYYVELFRSDYESILRVRPGITDLASIKYRDEAAILGQAVNPEEEYVNRVLPEKIQLAKEYVRRSSLCLDLSIVLQTVFSLAADRFSASNSKIIAKTSSRELPV